MLLLVSLLSYCYKYNYHNIITTFIIITIAVLIAIISIVVISNYHYYYYHYISNVTVISRPLTDTHINQLLFSFIHFFFFYVLTFFCIFFYDFQIIILILFLDEMKISWPCIGLYNNTFLLFERKHLITARYTLFSSFFLLQKCKVPRLYIMFTLKAA